MFIKRARVIGVGSVAGQISRYLDQLCQCSAGDRCTPCGMGHRRRRLRGAKGTEWWGPKQHGSAMIWMGGMGLAGKVFHDILALLGGSCEASWPHGSGCIRWMTLSWHWPSAHQIGRHRIHLHFLNIHVYTCIIYIYVCIYICIYMCVCVNHLKRCKTSNLGFICRGAQKAHTAVPNEPLYGVLRISRLITWMYLHSFFSHFTVNVFPIFGSGDRLSQEPACRLFGFSQTVSIWQQHWLWRWQLFDSFSGRFTDPFLSGVIGVFLRVRCIPQQNSQWQFWASACVCVCMCVCVCVNKAKVHKW